MTTVPDQVILFARDALSNSDTVAETNLANSALDFDGFDSVSLLF